MKFNTEDFFTKKENDTHELKEEYILSFSYFPGLYGKMCSIDFFVDRSFDYKLFMFWHEMTNESWSEEAKIQRLHPCYENKLPPKIRLLAENLFSETLDFKSDYFNDNNVYGVLDRTHTTFQLRQNANHFAIITSPDILDEKQFVSEIEIKFLALSKSIETWLFEMIDALMKIHNDN